MTHFRQVDTSDNMKQTNNKYIYIYIYILYIYIYMLYYIIKQNKAIYKFTIFLNNRPFYIKESKKRYIST